ncbi:sugar transferase [Sinanaerobacter sp. ZZT-01]|uniref:sugar transferase n=1 Tax=Sinanaerobacter sp. ZZT-01 TaxID=3111540 RepID=UPI002D7980AE|nr:sugar transferase [Sinanaerobacter sp. ZZT-01]WRR94887.1 sugar transferase [Sinanaerobacter sp. ZZT-01]
MKNTVKRLFDLIVSAGMLMILSPILLVLYVLCKIKLGSPAIFAQERPGLNGKVFKMYKFRSMTEEKDAEGNLLPDEIRLTTFGKKLRATSLDELPELINILKGEMSFVGPRPLLVKYLPLYSNEQARRHEVKPGLTGWAQVNGRNAIDWNQKFELDLWYVDHWSLTLDFKILCMTVAKVIKRDGVSAEGQATMGEFLGNKKGGEDHT